MPRPPRQMRLNQEHVDRLALLVPPGGDTFHLEPPPAGMVRATDADFAGFVDTILAGAGDTGEVWVFAYGSLIWKPAFEFIELRTGLLHGWHRAFCLGWNTRHRGSDAAPGLMLALDRGGRCKGALYRLPPGEERQNLDQLVRREMSIMPSPFPPRWVSVMTEQGPVRAVTFCIDRKSGRYVGGLDEDRVAEVLARAVGTRGSMVEYLFNTVRDLEKMGIHDAHLWRLQQLVAERLDLAP